jgi:hypothetical protein
MRLVKEEKHPNHELVKALKEKGYTNIFLIFAPRFSPDYGWTLDSDQFNNWIGFTKKEALKFIKEKL